MNIFGYNDIEYWIFVRGFQFGCKKLQLLSFTKSQNAKSMKFFKANVPSVIFDHLKYFVMFAKKVFLQ